MNFVKRCLKLIKNLAKNMNKDLATKIPNKNTVDNPREKFQLMVTSDNVASLLGKLNNTFADKL